MKKYKPAKNGEWIRPIKNGYKFGTMCEPSMGSKWLDIAKQALEGKCGS